MRSESLENAVGGGRHNERVERETRNRVVSEGVVCRLVGKGKPEQFAVIIR